MLVLGLWATLGIIPVVWSILTMTPDTWAYMQVFWRSGFFPPLPWDGDRLAQVIVLLLMPIPGLLHFLEWLVLPGLVLLGTGLWSLRGHEAFGALWMPTLVVLTAAALHQYPFGSPGHGARVIIFVLPTLVIALGAGADILVHRWGCIGAVFVGVMILLPALHPHPVYRYHYRPLFEHVATHKRAGDRLYVTRSALPSFRYYAPRLNLSGLRVIEGSCSPGRWPQYVADWSRLQGGGRTWAIISDQWGDQVGYFERQGRVLQHQKTPGAILMLVDLPATIDTIPAEERPEWPWLAPELDCRGIYDDVALKVRLQPYGWR